jgi:hypothetical protein
MIILRHLSRETSAARELMYMPRSREKEHVVSSVTILRTRRLETDRSRAGER